MELYELMDRCSARIKTILLELPGYTYFHGPSQPDHLDPHFIGRFEIIRKLRSLLTDSASPSGAYLVTGYRGAGKSSLVARVLSEVTREHRRSTAQARYARVLLPLFPLLFIGSLWTNSAPIALALLGLLILALLFVTDLQPTERPGDSATALTLNRLRRYLTLGPEPPPRFRARMLAQDLQVLLFLLALAGFTIGPIPGESFRQRAAALLSVTLLYFLVNYLLTQSPPPLSSASTLSPPAPGDPAGSSKQNADQRRLQPFRTLLHRLRHYVVVPIRRRINYGNKLLIQINLSQDNLREIDILRLMATTVAARYREYVNSWRFNLHWRLLRIAAIVVIVTPIYRLPDVSRISQGLVLDLHLPCYLPSQGRFLLADKDAYFDLLAARSPQLQPLRAATLRQSLQLAARAHPGETTTTHAFEHPTTDSPLGTLHRSAMNVLTWTDAALQLGYNGLARMLTAATHDIPVQNTPTAQEPPPAPPGMPPALDYLFLTFLFLGYQLLSLVPRWQRLGLTTHQLVLNRLTDLSTRIDAQVVHEYAGLPVQTSGSVLSLTFGRRRTYSHATLTEREIEKHLIDILWLIHRMPRVTSRPEFIFVFDELDKIQPHANIALTATEQAPADPTHSNDQLHERSSMEADRARQQRILALVSNLKHLLTTAPTKFIFIAGREMFDAALADVSDRHYFMGSVFNQVFHVPSFHADYSDGKLSDVTSLPEQYLSGLLLPSHEHPGTPRTLQLFGRYLSSTLLPDNDYHTQQKREKILYQLHHLLLYLTYRSNGAPKKLTQLLERHLLPPPEIPSVPLSGWRAPARGSEARSPPLELIAGKSSLESGYYLRLGYYDQYTSDLVTYVASPLVFSLNRSIKDFGDKILVSSSFLLDHIYKFHGHGFSWRNLELLPEIVDINRAPQLRALISEIMRFLGKSDVVEVVGGLHEFKFTKKVTEEISFLSKISESESAAFNFTLDESLALKRHFSRLLQRVIATYTPGTSDDREGAHHIHSVANMHMILGDLHFYDQDYEAAIAEYMDALQVIRYRPVANLRLDTLLLLVRNQLKLGLAFERRRSYSSALAAYSRLAEIVTSWCQSPQGRALADTLDLSSIRLLYQPFYCLLQIQEQAGLDGAEAFDIRQVERQLDRLGASSATKRSAALSERHNRVGDILYFKNGPSEGHDPYCKQITGPVLCLANEHRDQLLSARTDGPRRQLPCAACARYHAGLAELCSGFLGIHLLSIPRGQLAVYVLKALENPSYSASDVAHGPNAGRHDSLLELASTLGDLGDTFLSCADPMPSNNTVPLEARFCLGIASLFRRSPQHLQESIAYADELSSVWGAPGRRTKLEEAVTYYALAAHLYRRASSSRGRAQELIKILWVIRESLAILPRTREATGRRVTAPWTSDRTGTQRHPRTGETALSPDDAAALRDAARMIGDVAIEECYRSHEGAHRLEVERLKEVVETPGQPRELLASVNVGRLSIGVSVTEISVLLDEIDLRIDALSQKRSPKELDVRCSPYAMFHGVYARIHALRHRASINFYNFLRFEPEQCGLRIRSPALSDTPGGIERSPNLHDTPEAMDELLNLQQWSWKYWREMSRDLTDEEMAFLPPGHRQASGAPRCQENRRVCRRVAIEFFITDSIYCLHEICRLMAIYGPTYMASRSMRAAAHQHLADWCQWYYNYLRIVRFAQKGAEVAGDGGERPWWEPGSPQDPASARQRLGEAMTSLIGASEVSVALSPRYHADLALQYYREAREVHTEGRAYRELNERMSHLNDDFADQLEHFCAALERMRINSGTVDRAIRKLGVQVRETALFASHLYRTGGGSQPIRAFPKDLTGRHVWLRAVPESTGGYRLRLGFGRRFPASDGGVAPERIGALHAIGAERIAIGRVSWNLNDNERDYLLSRGEPCLARVMVGPSQSHAVRMTDADIAKIRGLVGECAWSEVAIRHRLPAHATYERHAMAVLDTESANSNIVMEDLDTLELSIRICPPPSGCGTERARVFRLAQPLADVEVLLLLPGGDVQTLGRTQSDGTVNAELPRTRPFALAATGLSWRLQLNLPHLTFVTLTLPPETATTGQTAPAASAAPRG